MNVVALVKYIPNPTGTPQMGDDFRLKKLFRDPDGPRGMHPAWETMIHSIGKGMFALRRPPAAATISTQSAAD